MKLKHPPAFYQEEARAIGRDLAERSAGRPESQTKLGQEPVLHSAPVVPQETDREQPVVVCLRDVAPEDIAFLWQRRIARGKLGILAGDPGYGKTTILLDCAARISRGGPWPDGGSAPQGNVVLLTAEDGLADTIRPRLDAMNADVSRIFVVPAIRNRRGEERSVSLVKDLRRLERVIRDTGAIFVVIDPLSAYLGGIDTFKDGEVRSVLAPVVRLAEQTRVAVNGIMHLSKATQRSALYRVQGSIGFVAASRLSLIVAEHPHDDTRRVLAPLKQNICQQSSVLAYRLDNGAVIWDDHPADDVDMDEVLSLSPGDRADRRFAAQWLRERFDAEPQIASVPLQKDAAADGISRRTLFRAKANLRIDAVKVGKSWFWMRPKAT